MQGLIHLYCGDGKGKTSIGIGMAIRCAGNDEKVLVAQFMKADTSSELKILKEIANITVLPNEKTFGFIWNMTMEEKHQAKNYFSDRLKKVIELATKENYRMVVLDEVVDAYNMEMINQEELLQFLKEKPEELEVVMTGRNPDENIISLSQYYSNIQKEKHPFDQGVKARKGIEF